MTKHRVTMSSRVRVIFRSTQIPVPAYQPWFRPLIGMWWASAVNGGSPVQKSRNLMVSGDDVFLFLVFLNRKGRQDSRQ
jgi:hypothetical protein